MHLLSLLVLQTVLGAADFVPPPDANIVNVRQYGAAGDGTTDDTAALRSAIRAAIEQSPSRYGAIKMVWLPRGTYRVSDSLQSRVSDSGWASGWRAGMILIGESQSATVIRLADGADGFGDVRRPRAVLATGSESDGADANPLGGGNRAFRHGIINLTVDVGAGNPGAVGIEFLASNRGTVEDVTIRARQGSGRTGLSLEKPWPGPALVKRVSIEGFDRGIAAAQHQYGMTFEHLRLIGQRQVGIRNDQNALWIRDLVSENTVPVVDAVGALGMITVIDGRFTGGVSDQPAIRASAMLYLRNIAANGYGTVVDDTSAADHDVPGDPARTITVDEYVSGAPLSVFDGATRALHLPVEETPEFTAPAEQWVSGSPDLQAAIDSGKAVVYLPNGRYGLERTLIIRGKVRRVIGLAASIGPARADRPIDPLIRFEDCGGESVTLEHLRIDGRVEHASRKALALRHCDHQGFTTGPTGKTFIEDVIGKGYQIAAGHRLWARQLNAEFGDAPLIVNRGTLWLLGWKTEGEMTCLANHGGAAEILGALFYPLRPVRPDTPCLLNDGGRLSATYVHNGGFSYAIQVRERRGETWRNLAREAVPGRGPALYVGAANQ